MRQRVPTASTTTSTTYKYPHLYEGIGKLKNSQVKLHIDTRVKPVAQGHRRVPFHLRKKVEQELEKLEAQDIIEKVDGPTQWISPIVTPPKLNDPNSIRLCVDICEANKAVLRERQRLMIHDLNGSIVFSKLDLRSDYHHLELHPNGRYIMSFLSMLDSGDTSVLMLAYRRHPMGSRIPYNTARYSWCLQNKRRHFRVQQI